VADLGRFRSLELRTAGFHLCGRLVGRMPQITTMKNNGAQESLKIFKENLMTAQEWTVPKCRKI